MSFILDYQYELLYSFGALFAFFSMLSYVVPVAVKVVRGDTSMDSSEQFFDGFEGPDLESIMTSGIDEDDDEEASVVSLGGN